MAGKSQTLKSSFVSSFPSVLGIGPGGAGTVLEAVLNFVARMNDTDDVDDDDVDVDDDCLFALMI